jgi:hypothetical protein
MYEVQECRNVLISMLSAGESGESLNSPRKLYQDTTQESFADESERCTAPTSTSSDTYMSISPMSLGSSSPITTPSNKIKRSIYSKCISKSTKKSSSKQLSTKRMYTNKNGKKVLKFVISDQ